MLLMQNNKSLSPEQNDALRAILKKIIDTEFGGNLSAASRSLKMSHSLITEVLAGGRGVGPKMLLALADHTKRGVDDLLGRKLPKLPIPPTAIGAVEGYAEIEARAIEQYGELLDPDILADVPRVSFGKAPDRLTPEIIKRVHDVLVDAYARNPRAKAAARAR